MFTFVLRLTSILVLGCLLGCTSEQARPVVLATTTSTVDSGLLDILIPVFEKQTGLTVKTVAVGTGQALEMGRRGEADLLLVHAPRAEQEFVSQGHGHRRRAVMHNDFVVVGPAKDPAGVKGTNNAAVALKKIGTSLAKWISRGDNSGTHMKERGLWQAADLHPNGDWYVDAGQGMGATLRVASEQRAYTLTDRGTFIAAQNIVLEVLVEGDPVLWNPYHVVEVIGNKVNGEGARMLADFFVAPKTQQMIGEFKRFGQQLFVPDAK